MSLKDLLESQIDIEESLPRVAAHINKNFWKLINEEKTEDEVIQDLLKYDISLAINDINNEIQRRNKRGLSTTHLEDLLNKILEGKMNEEEAVDEKEPSSVTTGDLVGEEGEKIYPTHKLGVSKLPRPLLDREDEISHVLRNK